MKRTDKNQALPEDPKYNQIWLTHEGHRVRILVSYMPGPRQVIETIYADGPVDGRQIINFDLDGNALLSEDWLVERES